MTPSAARDDALLQEIHELAAAGLRGEASEEQSQRLERLVVENPRARTLYVAYMQDTVTLEFWSSGRRALGARPLGGEDPPPPPISVPPVSLPPLQHPPAEGPPADVPTTVQIRTSPRPRRYTSGHTLFRIGTAAAVVAALTIGWSWWNQQPGGALATRPVAQLQSAVGAVWQRHDLAAGEKLPLGRVRLQAGLAELTFERGATVILEGPAEFETLAVDRLRFYAGQLTAQVSPAARGFTVLTADAELVDLGTEFGVSCLAGQPTELHVFTGRVEGTLQGEASPSPAIEAGAAARFDKLEQQVTAIPLDPARFARFMPVPGLWGEYFNERTLKGRTTGRVDPQINFTSPDWNLAPPHTGVTPDGIYGQRWSGFVWIERPGSWTFLTTSNDGVRLWVGGQLLIDRWDMHVDIVDESQLELSAGWHPIRLEHFQDGKDAGIVLRFSGPGQKERVIPTTHFSLVHPVTGERADQR